MTFGITTTLIYLLLKLLVLTALIRVGYERKRAVDALSHALGLKPPIGCATSWLKWIATGKGKPWLDK